MKWALQSVDALIAVSSFTLVKHGIREMVLRSEKQCRGVERLLSGGWATRVSLVNEAFERPMIVVVYTYQDFLPENLYIRQVAGAVKSGIRMPEGAPCEFNSFHVTDDGTIAFVGTRFVLSNHNVFADMIELMVEGRHFDMMVLLASDNRTMAAARFNLTSTTLYRGAPVAGRYSNREVLLETV